MDKEVVDAWESTIDKLGNLSPERRKHFALLLVNLADCYADDASAVILIHRDDNLMLFSAGATEFDAADMLSRANTLVNAVVTAEAPPKEMFN
jgi:hypothetical protein